MTQTPRLVRGGLTGAIFIVTKYEDEDDGRIVAEEKFDVTDEFNAMAEQKVGRYKMALQDIARYINPSATELPDGGDVMDLVCEKHGVWYPSWTEDDPVDQLLVDGRDDA